MTVHDLIRAKIKEKGLSLSSLSKDVLGKNHAYLQQFLERGVPAKLPEDVREKLAPALGVSESELKAAAPVNHPSKSPAFTVAGPEQLTFDTPLRVLGMAECGPDGWGIWNGDVIDTIPRPANLRGAKDAFAVYITGDSMAPRYHAGELAHIHPGKPITIGAYVLVQKRPKASGEPPLAVIKRLVKRSGDRIVLEQFNPPKTFEIKAGDLVSMHRVVGSGEA